MASLNCNILCNDKLYFINSVEQTGKKDKRWSKMWAKLLSKHNPQQLLFLQLHTCIYVGHSACTTASNVFQTIPGFRIISRVYFEVTVKIQFYGARLKFICADSCSWYVAWGIEALKFALCSEWILKRAIIQRPPRWRKAHRLGRHKLNTWTGRSLAGPAHTHTHTQQTGWGSLIDREHQRDVKCSACEVDLNGWSATTA